MFLTPGSCLFSEPSFLNALWGAADIADAGDHWQLPDHQNDVFLRRLQVFVHDCWFSCWFLLMWDCSMVVVVGSKLTLRLSIFLPQRAERNEVSSKIKKILNCRITFETQWCLIIPILTSCRNTLGSPTFEQWWHMFFIFRFVSCPCSDWGQDKVSYFGC